METLSFFLAIIAAAALSTSCQKLDDLILPKDDQDKVEDVLKGSWSVDTSAFGMTEQNPTIRYDTIMLNQGTLDFRPRSKETGSNYGIGQLYRTRPMAGGSQTDTLHWMCGIWGSSGLGACSITIFMANDPDGSFKSSSSVNLDILQKDKNKFRIAGTRAYDMQSGIIIRHNYRYALSK